jgi:6-phosphogluconolactonase (cycloisomerase 2 family)
MILSANGSFMYVPDTKDLGANSAGIMTPSIYAFNVSGTTLTYMAGQPFHGNAAAVGGAIPTNPVAGATTHDTRYLFIANQSSHNISAFQINSTSGEPTEVLGSTTTVNGVQVSTASPFDCGCTTPSFTSVTNANNGLYVVDDPAGKIYQFQIDQNTGRLRAQNPASVSAETATSNPTWITIR